MTAFRIFFFNIKENIVVRGFQTDKRNEWLLFFGHNIRSMTMYALVYP